MSNDPLAAYRRERSQRNGMGLEQGSNADKPDQAQEPLTEHQALKLAIDALNQVPNRSLTGEYRNTYALIPVLGQAYEAGKEKNPTPYGKRMLDTLGLCEEALTRLGSAGDGRVPMQAITDIQAIIQVIKREINQEPAPAQKTREIDIEPER